MWRYLGAALAVGAASVACGGKTHSVSGLGQDAGSGAATASGSAIGGGSGGGTSSSGVTSGSSTSGDATSGTATSGDATSGTATSGGATSGTTMSGTIASSGSFSGTGASGLDGGPIPCADASHTRCNDVCVSTANDVNNCGGCNVNCTGGSCAAGVCTLVPLSAARAGSEVLDFPPCLAVDSQSVYIATGQWQGGEILKAPLSGGAPQTIVSGQHRPTRVASDGTHVFWVNHASGEIMRAGTDGSNPTSLVMSQSPQSNPDSLVIDLTHVYWENRGDGTVWQADKDGGNPIRLANGLSRSSFLATDATEVFFAEFGGAVIMAAPIGGASPAQVAVMNQAGVQGLAIGGTRLFWSSWVWSNSVVMTGTIMARQLGMAQAMPSTLAMNLDAPAPVVTDGTSVYWSEPYRSAASPPTGAIKRVAASGTGNVVVTLAANQYDVTCMALDPTSVYWVMGGGVVRKAAK